MSKSNVLPFKRKKKDDEIEAEHLTPLQVVEIGCSGDTPIEIKRLMIDTGKGAEGKRSFLFIIYAYLIEEKEIKAYIFDHETSMFFLEWSYERGKGQLRDHITELDSGIIEHFKFNGDGTMTSSMATDLYPFG